MKHMKSQGELWTTTEEGIGAITVVLLREAGGGVGSWMKGCTWDAGKEQVPPAPSLPQARWDPSGLKDLSSRSSKPMLACKVQKHLPTLGSRSLDHDLLPSCHGAAERKPWGSTTLR